MLVEDDAQTAECVELMLKAEAMSCYSTDLGEEAVELAKLYDYDIILLDLNLPDISGYEVLRRLRSVKIKTPVMVVSGMAGVEDKVKAFNLGADDYLTKPFHKGEMVARIQAIVRRSKGHAQSVIEIDGLAIDLDRKVVSLKGVEIHLSGKEYELMELLALRRGAVLTKEMIMNHLYGGMDEPELKIIDVFVHKLRKKLGDAGELNRIKTVWGQGYVLNDGRPAALAAA